MIRTTGSSTAQPGDLQPERGSAASSPLPLPAMHPHVLYAVDDGGRRSVLPSSENYFGGVRVRRVLVDPGRGAHLLPLDGPGTLDEVYGRFPPAQYAYDVMMPPADAGEPDCLILQVSRTDGGAIAWRLCQDFHPVGLEEHARLRFALCREDAARLWDDACGGRLAPAGAGALPAFLRRAEALRDAWPGCPLGRRLRHGWLGADALEGVGNGMVARGRLTMVGARDDLAACGAMAMSDAEAEGLASACAAHLQGQADAEDIPGDGRAPAPSAWEHAGTRRSTAGAARNRGTAGRGRGGAHAGASRPAAPARARRERRPQPRWRFDWDGFEAERDEVFRMATRVQEMTDAVEAECKERGWMAAGAIGCAIRSPEEAERIFSPMVADLGRLNLALREFNTRLIYVHGLHCDVVMRESYRVLDPARLPRWDALIETTRARQERDARLGREFLESPQVLLMGAAWPGPAQ